MNRCRGQNAGLPGALLRRGGIVVSIVIAMMVTMTEISKAQTSKPAALPAYENQPLRRSSQAANAISTTQNAMETRAALQPAPLVDFRRLVLSLAIVVGLIFALCGLGKYFFPNATSARTTSAVRILSRSAMAHKRHVLLMQVGRRVLVVADNGTQMNALSEITDPDEVAQLIGQTAGANGSGETEPDHAFDAAFGKAKTSFEVDPNDQPTADASAAGSSEMPDPSLAEVQPATEPGGEMAGAHGEINGLMEKVRRLTQQLSRS